MPYGKIHRMRMASDHGTSVQDALARWDQDHRISTTSERPEGLCIAPLSSDAHTPLRLILYRLIHSEQDKP
jgi:hypothetical protein